MKNFKAAVQQVTLERLAIEYAVDPYNSATREALCTAALRYAAAVLSTANVTFGAPLKLAHPHMCGCAECETARKRADGTGRIYGRERHCCGTFDDGPHDDACKSK